MGKKAYRHDRDAQTLRDALGAVKAASGIGTQALLDQFHEQVHLPKHVPNISRPALDKFMAGGASNRGAALTALHDFLWEHDIFGVTFRKHFPAEAGDAGDFTASLSAALLGFFSLGGSKSHSYEMDVMRKSCPGRYVMYRPDMRPIVKPVRPNGLVRASDVTIDREGSAVVITESQSFPEGPLGPRHSQKNVGVMFPHGRLLLFIMRGKDRVSFKAGVVETSQSYGDGPVEWFRGSLFVASDLAVFQVVRFFCLRNDAGELKTGYLPPESLKHAEASAYLCEALERLEGGRQPATTTTS